MKFLCLVYLEEKEFEVMPERELDALVAECNAWIEDADRSSYHIASFALQSVRTATTLRQRKGKLSMTDGPFAETKEQLGGFTLIEARDLNEALQIASRLPPARTGSIEVRPVLEPDSEAATVVDRRFEAAMRRVAKAAGDGR